MDLVSRMVKECRGTVRCGSDCDYDKICYGILNDMPCCERWTEEHKDEARKRMALDKMGLRRQSDKV